MVKLIVVAPVVALGMVAACGADYSAQSPQAESRDAVFQIVLPDEPKPWEKTARPPPKRKAFAPSFHSGATGLFKW